LWSLDWGLSRFGGRRRRGGGGRQRRCNRNRRILFRFRLAKKLPREAQQNARDESHADYDESSGLEAMLRANLVAERVAIEAYSQMIRLIGDKDSTTRRVLESILSEFGRRSARSTRAV